MGVLGAVGVLAPRWRWFDLSLMSSQHLAAPGLPRPSPRLHNSLRIRKSQFPHCTVHFTRGKSHFPGRAAGSASLPSLACCHRHRRRHWAPIRRPTPAPGDPSPPALWVPLCSWALAPATWKEQEKVLSGEDTERRRQAVPAASSF